MDVKQYFRKIREVEAVLSQDYPVLVSLETSDGGKAGLLAEVERSNAARMIVEGRAALANEEQVAEFREQQTAAKKNAERVEMTKRIQLAIVSDSDLQNHMPGKRGTGPSSNGK